jgi:hypothetical protein
MWEFEHSVETAARREFAWKFWTNVDNWVLDTSVEWVRLSGQFATGSEGATKSPGLDPMNWILREVIPQQQATIEMPLDGATLLFEWRFEDTEPGGTLITQRVSFTGEKADSFAERVAPAFEAGIPQGMQRLAVEVELAEETEGST